MLTGNTNVGPIPPTYEKITPAQRQLLEFAKNGNAEGIRNMAQDTRYLTVRSLIKLTIINCTDEWGWTPLMLAIRMKHHECVSALYQAGARTDTRVSVTVPYANLIGGTGANECAVNPLMYAVITFCQYGDPTALKCVRELFARRKGSSANAINSTQTELHYLVNVQSDASGGSIEFSPLTFAIMFANREKVVSRQLLELLKLLLHNGVRIRGDDFYNFNLQHTEMLRLLLDQLKADIFQVVTNFVEIPYLATVIKLKHANKYKPVSPKKLRASANLLIDYFTDKKLCKRRRELANHDEEWLQYITNAAPWFFYNAVKYQVAEIVDVCIERNVRFLEGHNISMSRKAGVDSKDMLMMDGKYKITNPPVSLPISWDILRQVLAYRERLGEDVRLSDTLIKRIVHRRDFLVDANVDVDVLTGFGVPDDICDIDDYNYESKITEVQAHNLGFAIKHGFDLPDIDDAHILVHVHNQKEFDKAFFFMRITSVVIDLGGGTYHLPTTDIGLWWPLNVHPPVFRIQNGYITGDFEWLLQTFDGFQVAGSLEVLGIGDIITVVQEDLPPITGMLSKKPSKGRYTFADGQKIRVKQEFVTKISIPLEITPADVPAAPVIMNAMMQELNTGLLMESDIDDLDFNDGYWKAQTAETLGQMTWGRFKGIGVISMLLVHSWNLSDGYTDGDVYQIFKQFVDFGAYIPPNFGQIMLANADDYPLSDGIQDGADIYDLLRKECPEYTFGKKEQSEFIKFAKSGDDPNSFLRTKGTFNFFYHVLEVENSGGETYFPIFPYYITKICDIVRKGKDYELDAYLAKFLMYVGATNVDSTVAVACVKQLLAAGFDINYNQHPDIRIPLFYVLDNGNDLVLEVFMASDKLDVNQNVHPNVDQTALESLLLNIRDRDTARIMIHKMLQDDRVECPFRQHTLSARQVDAAPEIVDFLLARKYFQANSRDYHSDKPREWYFNPNTVPLYEMRWQNTWKKKLQEQGIEPEWCRVTDEYTKAVQSDLSVAYKVVQWRGLALQHIPKKRMNHLLCFFAVTSDGLAFEFLPIKYKMSWNFIVNAIIQNWRAFQFLPEKAYYERVKEVNIEDRKDIQQFLKEINDMYGKNGAEQLFKDAAKGLIGEYKEGDIKLLFSRIDNLDFNGQNNAFGLDELTKKTFAIMKTIDADLKKVDYVYKGLPSKSEHDFVVWIRHLFDKGGPHEGEWSAFKKMFPKAAYGELNPDTHRGRKEIEKEKSQERKEKEKESIQKLNHAVHAQLGKDVDIVHWDDFEPIMFS